MIATLAFDIANPLASSGAENCLILDPDALRVYTFSTIGNAVPEAAWHKRHHIIARLPNNYIADSLQAWCEAQTEALLSIASLCTSAPVGMRQQDWDELIAASVTNLGEELIGEMGISIITTQDAADWMGQDLAGCVQDAVAAGTMAKAVQSIMAFAVCASAMLNEAAVTRVLRRALTDRIDAGEDTDGALARLLNT